jgi:hypothetical protein
MEIEEVNQRIIEHLERRMLQTSRFLAPVRSNVAQGEPFFQDMIGRFPSLKLRMDVRGVDISVERIYDIARPFGKVVDVVLEKAAVHDATIGRHFSVRFKHMHGAIGAKQCLHRYKIDGSSLYLNYEPVLTMNTVSKFYKENARFTVPISVIMTSWFGFIVLEPVRIWILWNSLSRWWELENLQTDFASIWTRVGVASSDVQPTAAWFSETVEHEKLANRLASAPDGLLLVQGPVGSGKSFVIDTMAARCRYSLKIDCSSGSEASGDDDPVEAFARAIGYKLTFNSLGNIVGAIEHVLPADTKLRTAAPERLRTILRAVTVSLWLNQTFSPSGSGEPALVIFDGVQDLFDGGETKSAADPGRDALWRVFATWCVSVTEQGLAHVVLVGDHSPDTEDLVREALGKAERCLVTTSVQDGTSADVEKFLRTSLLKSDLPEPKRAAALAAIPRAVHVLGGRYSDITQWMRRTIRGEDPQILLNESLQEAVGTVRRLGWPVAQPAGSAWTTRMIWQTMTILAEMGAVNYDALLNSEIFKGRESALRGMLSKGILTLEEDPSGQAIVKPASPLFRQAFLFLVNDRNFALGCNIASVEEEMVALRERLKRVEEELDLLGGFKATSRDIGEGVAKRRASLEADIESLSVQLEGKESRWLQLRKERKQLLQPGNVGLEVAEFA